MCKCKSYNFCWKICYEIDQFIQTHPTATANEIEDFEIKIRRKLLETQFKEV